MGWGMEGGERLWKARLPGMDFRISQSRGRGGGLVLEG